MNVSMLRKSSFPVVLLLSTLISGTAQAAGGPSSWNTEPAWAAEPDYAAPPARRSSGGRTAREIRNANNVSPFSPGSNNIALDIGQVFLMGNMGSRYSDSIGVQLHYTYGVSDLFGFDSSIGYSEHSDGRMSMTTVLTGLRTNLAWYDKVVPYLVFGLGFYKPSHQVGSLNSVSPLLFGVHIGPGVNLELTKQFFFGTSLTFHDVFGGTQNIPGGTMDVGGTYTSFLLHAGFTF
jgi:hypothetical protein